VNEKGKLGNPTARSPTKDVTAMPNLVDHIMFNSAWLQLMDIMRASV
jgi:hypothetical protein